MTDLDTQELTLPQGKIRGVKRNTIYEQPYYSFEGIPYGKPPTGKSRFRAPEPAEPWTDVRDCSSCASKPIQKNIFTGEIEGAEDCLYLNVYAKTLNSENPLPVMVFIYGGGFYMGEATKELYSPDYFMGKNVVLVHFNYRLCSLGFLSLNDPALKVPGNAGLKDQVLALKWVKHYISFFNGDPNNITVFGESAGGASTHHMMLTEQTRGLFHKAIPMSGCALNSWANIPQADFAYRLAKYHGYEGENIDEQVLDYLRTLEPRQLVEHALINDEERRNGILFPFGPTIEPYVGEDCVFSKPPLELLKNAWSNEIPMMHGGVSFEGLLMYPRLKMFPQSMNAVKKNPERLLPVEVRNSHSAEEIQQLSSKLVKLHFGDKVPDQEHMFDFLDLYSYKVFWHGFHRTILARLAYAAAPTYLYRFDFDSPDFNHYRAKFCGQDSVRGVAHADDLSYLFFSRNSWKVAPESEEFKTIQRMVGIWTAFAKQSDPNCEEIKPIRWEPLEKSNPNRAVNISNELKVMDLPEASKLEFWNSMYTPKELY